MEFEGWVVVGEGAGGELSFVEVLGELCFRKRSGFGSDCYAKGRRRGAASLGSDGGLDWVLRRRH